METSNGMNKSFLFIIGAGLVLLVMGTMQFLFPRTAVSPSPSVSGVSSEGNNGATSTEPVQVVSVPNTVPSKSSLIERSDTIISWNFKGVYADRPDLITKANSEIKRFLDLIGTGAYTDMILYVSIANQYDLLGDGKQEYDYLNRAIQEGGSTTGLPWHNLGVLMERLGALQTARVAYEKATLVQPELKQWHYAYLEFLTTRMKDDTAIIEKAFAAALANLSQTSDILQLRSEWEAP